VVEFLAAAVRAVEHDPAEGDPGWEAGSRLARILKLTPPAEAGWSNFHADLKTALELEGINLGH
jgi:hypothetical protein